MTTGLSYGPTQQPVFSLKLKVYNKKYRYGFYTIEYNFLNVLGFKS